MPQGHLVRAEEHQPSEVRQEPWAEPLVPKVDVAQTWAQSLPAVLPEAGVLVALAWRAVARSAQERKPPALLRWFYAHPSAQEAASREPWLTLVPVAAVVPTEAG